MQDLELEETAWILKEVRAIKREQRLLEQQKPLPKPTQLELPLSSDSKPVSKKN